MGVQSKFVRGDDGAALKDALFLETGVDGVYARTGLYEGVVEALTALISAYRPAGTVRGSPMTTRATPRRPKPSRKACCRTSRAT